MQFIVLHSRRTYKAYRIKYRHPTLGMYTGFTNWLTRRSASQAAARVSRQLGVKAKVIPVLVDR